MSFDASVLDRLGLAAWLALSIKTTLVLAIGAAAAWLLRRRSAAGRHFVWLLTLNAVLGVTAFATLPRGLAVEVPRWPRWASASVAAPPPGAMQGVVADAPTAPGLRDAPAVHGETDATATRIVTDPTATHGVTDPPAAPGVTVAPQDWPMEVQEAAGVTRSAGGHELAHGAAGVAKLPLATRPAAIPSPGSLLIVVWLAGTCLLLGWLALGHVGLAWIARRSKVIDDPMWRTLLRRLANEAGVAQPPRLCSSAAIGGPLACGLFRPSILLPVEAGSWGPERRRVVLLHELAHIARRDPLAQSIAWLACAIYWFQPAVWLAFARMRAEGERACDDRVLSTGVAAPDYASHLLSLARRARALRLAGAVSVAMARGSTLEGRLLAMLDDGVRRGGLGVRARGAGIATLALVLVALGLVRPVPPAAAVARAVSSASGAVVEPAANPSQAPVALSAFSREAIPAEPPTALATNPSVVSAVDLSAVPAPDPSAAPAVDPSAPAVDPPAAPAAEGAGAAFAQSAVETFNVASGKAEAGTESFHADPPARPPDTPEPASKSAPPTRPSTTGLFVPISFVSAPAAGPAPGPAPGPVTAAGARTWNNQAGGQWSNPANWTPADVPDSPGESAVLPALSGAYQVTLDIDPAVDAISIDAGDATLDVGSFSIAQANLVNNSGTIRNFAGEYNGNRIRNLKGGAVIVAPRGTIQVGANDLWNAGTIVAAKEIQWAGCVLLWGGGTLVLNDTRLLDPNVDQDVTDQYNRVMTIASGTTLRGTGVVYKQMIQNSGLIQADVAQLPKVNLIESPEQVLWFNGTITNRGTIRVMNGGHINVNRPVIYNENGLITSGPGGGSLRLEMPFKMFGTIGVVLNGGFLRPAPGFIRADGGDLEIGINEMNAGTIQRGPGGGVVKMAHVFMRSVTVDAGAELHFRPVAVYGTQPDAPLLDIGSISGMSNLDENVITNNGTIRFTGGLVRNSWSDAVQAKTIIRGSGELILEDATIGAGGGDVFVNGAGHTIRGCGTINAPFLNEGTVALDCSGGKSARIGGRAIPLSVESDGTIRQPGGAIENRGRISIARGNLSITGPEGNGVTTPTILKNKGTITAAGGKITLEKSVTLDNTGGGVLSAGGGGVSLGGMTGATVIGGRLDASGGNLRKAENLRGAPGFDNVFRVEKAVTLRDVTLGQAATLVTAAGAVTTASGARVVNEGTNRIAGTFAVSPGTGYFQTTGETVIEGGEFLGAIMRGAGRGEAGVGASSASIASAPATLRFYARNESRSTSLVLELPQAAELKGRLYDAAGREVARLADGVRDAGVHTFAVASGTPNGIYFARMLVSRQGSSEALSARVAVIR